MRGDRDTADDNGPGVDGLADGTRLAAGSLRPLHRGGRADAPALQHARPPRLLSIQRRRLVCDLALRTRSPRNSVTAGANLPHPGVRVPRALAAQLESFVHLRGCPEWETISLL